VEARPKGRPSFWVNVSVLVATDLHTERRLIVHLVRDISKRRRTERFAAEVVGLTRRLESGRDDGEVPPTQRLTAQERRILELIRDGHGSEEIARELEISIGTLRNHVHDLNRKLSTHSRVEAVMQAAKRGLI